MPDPRRLILAALERDGRTVSDLAREAGVPLRTTTWFLRGGDSRSSVALSLLRASGFTITRRKT